MPDLKQRLGAALTGRFAVRDEIGRGGMATVFAAEDLKHRRTVAVKVLHPELAAALGAERFLREIEIAARLQHPHIVPLYDSGAADGLLYYLMPFIDGESLGARLERDGPLGLDEALRVVLEVADALDYAHREGVVHRDIKPDNVMLSDGHALVTDFGIATAVTTAGGEGLTQTGMALGTPRYMSPEQIDGTVDLDGRTDIYSLGCVLYEVLAGEAPFDGPTPIAVLAKHAAGAYRPLATLGADVPPGVEDVIERSIARDREERFGTASDFARALEEAPHAAPRPGARRGERAIAVLPFANMSPDPEAEYFSDGIAEDIMNALSRLPALKVTARSSAFAFRGQDLDVRQIGRKLGVTTVLEGTVRKAGNRVRVTVQLVEPEEGVHLWSETFDRELSDIFAIQDEITDSVVQRVAPKLVGDAAPSEPARAPNPSPQAYELYLRGRYNWYKRFEIGLQTAIEFFQKAIEADPSYAPPWAGLADAFHTMGIFGFLPPAAARAKASAAIERALALDPRLPEAHFSRGCHAQFFDWDLDAGERAFATALELNPGHAEAMAWRAFRPVLQGRAEEGLAMAARARALAPDSAYVATLASLSYVWAGRFEECRAACRWVLEREPGLSTASVLQGDAAAALDDQEESVAMFERAVDLTARHPSWLALAGAAHGRAGSDADVERIRGELEERSQAAYAAPATRAALDAQAGNVDAALRHVEAALDERSPTLFILAPMPIFAPLRNEPRFLDAVRAMGMNPEIFPAAS